MASVPKSQYDDLQKRHENMRKNREREQRRCSKLEAALAELLSGDVGRQTMAKLATGQGTDTDDGRAPERTACTGWVFMVRNFPGDSKVCSHVPVLARNQDAERSR